MSRNYSQFSHLVINLLSCRYLCKQTYFYRLADFLVAHTRPKAHNRPNFLNCVFRTLGQFYIALHSGVSDLQFEWRSMQEHLRRVILVYYLIIVVLSDNNTINPAKLQ